LDAGHHFSLDDRGDVLSGSDASFRGQGLRVPSLAEAFEAFPGVRFNLEIKTASPGVVARVIDLIAKYDREAATLLVASEDDTMREIRRELAARRLAAATSASVSEVVSVVRAAAAGSPPPDDIMALQIPMEFGGKPLVTPALVAHAKAYGIQLHVWTVNDRDAMRELLRLGVDGLVTDFPERAVEVVARQSGQ